MSTPFEFYAISNYFILLKMYHEITKIYKDKVESTGTIVWPLKRPILSDQ